jgi:hypothetical protein
VELYAPLSEQLKDATAALAKNEASETPFVASLASAP